MIESNLIKLQTFLPTFLNVSENAKLELVDRHQSILSSLFTESLLIEKKRLNEIHEKGLNFNIFDILRFGHYETRLHTPFLVNLLDPNGTHNTGQNFFILFIKLAFSHDFEQNKIENIEVIEELATDDLDGRIDIYISFLYKGENYYLAIENKIHACDQEKQLERYYEFLNSKTTCYDKIKLIYLTKHGQRPSIPWSISSEVFKEIQDNNVYKSMSHHRDVCNLIEDMIDKNSMPERIKTLMVQYTEIIKRL